MPKIRLYVPHAFSAGQQLTLDAGQTHYLAHVMRLQAGDALSVFNGSQGEWRAEAVGVAQRLMVIQVVEQQAPQRHSPDVWLAFAPLKNKLDVVVEKAVELGVSALLPVFTAHGVVNKINREKLDSYIVSAAEQCARHDLPSVTEYADLGALLAAWPEDRLLLHADETGGGENIRTVLEQIANPAGVKCGVLIGPEGGFSREEIAMLRASRVVRAFTMGPRILRADTAAVAALACVQAWLGDWEDKPQFKAAS